MTNALALAVNLCVWRAISFDEFTAWLDHYVVNEDDPPTLAFDLMEPSDYVSWYRSDAVKSLRTRALLSPSEHATVRALFVLRAPDVVNRLRKTTDDRYMSAASARAITPPTDPFLQKLTAIFDTVDFTTEQQNPSPLFEPGK